MTSSILLTGGTGTLGRLVTPLLRGAGAELRVLSRQSHEPTAGIEYVTGDLLKNEGIAAAVDGAETVVHLAGGPKGDEEATRNLVQASSRAGVQHLVLISVVAADQVPLGYFRAKLGAEHAVAESDVPYTTLRAAQFHDLILLVMQKMSKLPVIPAPHGVRLEPVDTGEVAARMVELALDKPAGMVPDLAGPRVYTLADAARAYLRAGGKHRPLLRVRMPGKAGRVYRAGRNLAGSGADRGKRTWEEFLAERLR